MPWGSDTREGLQGSPWPVNPSQGPLESQEREGRGCQQGQVLWRPGWSLRNHQLGVQPGAPLLRAPPERLGETPPALGPKERGCEDRASLPSVRLSPAPSPSARDKISGADWSEAGRHLRSMQRHLHLCLCHPGWGWGSGPLLQWVLMVGEGVGAEGRHLSPLTLQGVFVWCPELTSISLNTGMIPHSPQLLCCGGGVG